jgi:hypothetical protein
MRSLMSEDIVKKQHQSIPCKRYKYFRNVSEYNLEFTYQTSAYLNFSASDRWIPWHTCWDDKVLEGQQPLKRTIRTSIVAPFRRQIGSVRSGCTPRFFVYTFTRPSSYFHDWRRSKFNSSKPKDLHPKSSRADSRYYMLRFRNHPPSWKTDRPTLGSSRNLSQACGPYEPVRPGAPMRWSRFCCIRRGRGCTS